MANEFGHALVPITITKTATTAGIALYSVSRFVYSFNVQKNTSTTNVTVGTQTSGVQLTATLRTQAYAAISLGTFEPMQYDLSRFFVATTTGTAAVVITAIVKKAQAGNPPS